MERAAQGLQFRWDVFSIAQVINFGVLYLPERWPNSPALASFRNHCEANDGN